MASAEVVDMDMEDGELPAAPEPGELPPEPGELPSEPGEVPASSGSQAATEPGELSPTPVEAARGDVAAIRPRAPAPASVERASYEALSPARAPESVGVALADQPRSRPPPRRAGRLELLQNFEELATVGQGTFGVVIKARYKSKDRVVAVKKFRLVDERDGFPITAIREIKILKMLRGKPGIVELLDMAHGQSGNGPATTEVGMVLEYMDFDLAKILSDRRNVFTEQHIKSYMRQLFAGVASLHKMNIVHRDLKSSNVLMNLRGELKLADFGLSRLIPDRAYDLQDGMTNKVCTLWYRAPELLLGSRDYGLAIDIWAAGCIFAEFFIRQPLFKSEYNDDAGGQIEQLHKVALLCGAPSEDVWEGVSRLPDHSKFNFDNAQYRRRIVDEFGQHVRGTGLALFDQLLSLDPSKRPDAMSVLMSDWFYEAPLPLKPGQIRATYYTHQHGASHESPAVLGPRPGSAHSSSPYAVAQSRSSAIHSGGRPSPGPLAFTPGGAAPPPPPYPVGGPVYAQQRVPQRYGSYAPPPPPPPPPIGNVQIDAARRLPLPQPPRADYRSAPPPRDYYQRGGRGPGGGGYHRESGGRAPPPMHRASSPVRDGGRYQRGGADGRDVRDGRPDYRDGGRDHRDGRGRDGPDYYGRDGRDYDESPSKRPRDSYARDGR